MLIWLRLSGFYKSKIIIVVWEVFFSLKKYIYVTNTPLKDGFELHKIQTETQVFHFTAKRPLKKQWQYCDPQSRKRECDITMALSHEYNSIDNEVITIKTFIHNIYV